MAVDRRAVGLGFWIVVIALGTSNSVRMPGGTIVDVSIAPVLGVRRARRPFCGRDLAAAVGLFELREVRGLVPGTSRRRSVVRLCSTTMRLSDTRRRGEPSSYGVIAVLSFTQTFSLVAVLSLAGLSLRR